MFIWRCLSPMHRDMAHKLANGRTGANSAERFETSVKRKSRRVSVEKGAGDQVVLSDTSVAQRAD